MNLRYVEAMLNVIYRYFVRLHRWLALAFATPLFVVIATGLVLSFEPIAQQARPDRPITRRIWKRTCCGSTRRGGRTASPSGPTTTQ